MNERIKELAEQAGLDIDDSLAVEPEPTYYGTQLDFEKFAELIVRECISETYLVNTPFDVADHALEMARARIAEHFGVEE